MLQRCGKYLLARWALVVALGALGLWARLSAPAPPEPTLEALAAMLGEAVDGEVDPQALIWEPSGGGLTDPLLGRRVLFLAAIDGGPRDLHRATVRVSREGRPIEVRRTCNLTDTRVGDESDLVARGHRVAFSTRAFDAVQGVTLLDLRGRRRPGRWWQRGLAAAESWLGQASLTAVGRTDLVFDPPPGELQLELRDELLVMALGDPPHPAAYELDSAKLNLGGRAGLSARHWTTDAPPRSLRQLLSSLLRGALGRAAAERLEAGLASLTTPRGPARDDAAGEAPAPGPDAEGGSWPPPGIAGTTWRAPSAAHPRLVGVVGDPDPALLQATLRLDGGTLELVAMDMRQLELRLQAGQRWPHSQSGPAASGRLDEADRPIAVAAFNGALAAGADDGMVVARRVLVPPRRGAATVVVAEPGRGRIGAWPGDDTVPPSLVALRQSLDPLIEDGVINPRGRKGWGMPKDARLRLERSALCRSRAGHLLYAWSEAIDADTLARGLLEAGCGDALHLAMSPLPTGFAYLSGEGDPSGATLLSAEMAFDPAELFSGAASDFFYLVLRNVAPATGKIGWQPDGGEQPPPAWLPAVHRARIEKLGVEVSLWSIDVERFRWQIRPGNRERAGLTSEGPLETAELARAMIAVSLGVGFRKDNRRGLALDGMVSLPIHGDRGVLATEPDGRLSITRSLDDMAPRGDASELVVLAAAGTLRSEAKRIGARGLRAAACMLEDGTMLIAQATFDSSQPIAGALLELGCRRIVSLNRGSQVRAFVHRAGSEPPPQAEYEDTVLYGMSRPAEGRFRSMRDP